MTEINSDLALLFVFVSVNDIIIRIHCNLIYKAKNWSPQMAPISTKLDT